ncbi:MAG: hypothetical protein JWN18_726 [Parcubacteria group bacterium]|nr:hypothetical protein [Parcubacteria group bacterium]
MKSAVTHLIITSCIALGAVGAFTAWYLFVQHTRAHVADLETQIARKIENSQRIAEARASLAEIAGEEAAIQSYFVPEANVVPFIDSLEAEGHTFGTLVKVTAVSKANVKSRPALTFALTVGGSFDSVLRTVGAIEYSPYNVSITALALTRDDKGVWAATLTITVASLAQSANTSTPHA